MTKDASERETELKKGREIMTIFENLDSEGKRAIFYYGQGLLVGGMAKKSYLKSEF